MKVLHVIPAVAPRYGGPSRAVVGMCRALRARGVETTIATTDADGAGRLDVPLGVPAAFEGMPAVFFARYGEGFKYSPPLARWLRRETPAFDVVHIHAVFSHSSIAAARAARLAGVPYLVRPLGSLDPWSLEQKRVQKRALFLLGVRAMLANAFAVQYTTDAERDLATAAAGAARSVVVPLGLDDETVGAEAPPASARQPIVLALTRLHPKKRLDLLIDAFLQAAKAPDARAWTLVIAGAGADADEAALRQQVVDRGAADRVRFAGWVDGVEKQQLLRSAALFAAPSHTENFGLGALEAMAAGVPVVITRGVNLSPEVIANDAGWVTDGDPGALAQALGAGIADADERARRAANARRLAGRFTWSAAAAALEAIYRDAMTASRGAVAMLPAGAGR
jgi:glycosyltransferase involved in cell wall biosynthesis